MTRERWLWGGGTVGILLAGALLWWLAGGPGSSPSGKTGEQSLTSLDPKQMEIGRAIYQVNCAQCHGPKGEGHLNWREQNPDDTYPPPPHDSSGHTWHHGDGLLYRIIRDGGTIYETTGFKSAMPAFGDQLSPDEIKAVISYLKSLWGPQERAAQAEVSLEDPFPP